MNKKDKMYICTNPNCNQQFKFRGYSDEHKYCSISCSKEHRTIKKEILWEQRYNSWISGELLDVVNTRPLIREFVIKRDGYQCAVCGISNWNGKEITLWTDHIDGNATNNSPSNFRLVCPNCDSQSPTFGGKNYGNGRKSRGLSQYG